MVKEQEVKTQETELEVIEQFLEDNVDLIDSSPAHMQMVVWKLKKVLRTYGRNEYNRLVDYYGLQDIGFKYIA